MTLEPEFERLVEVLVKGGEGIPGAGTHKRRLADINVSVMLVDA